MTYKNDIPTDTINRHINLWKDTIIKTLNICDIENNIPIDTRSRHKNLCKDRPVEKTLHRCHIQK